MINHSQNIIINSEKQKIWNFIIDFSRSLVFIKKAIELSDYINERQEVKTILH